jgi:hypothetical protein
MAAFIMVGMGCYLGEGSDDTSPLSYRWARTLLRYIKCWVVNAPGECLKGRKRSTKRTMKPTMAFLESLL